MGGFSANGGVTTKLRLLSIERDGTRLNGTAAPELTAAELGYDPVAAVAHLRDADSALARLIDAVGPFRMRVDRTSSLFLALAEAIVYQQLTGKAAATIFARVQALFPRAHEGFEPRAHPPRVRREAARAPACRATSCCRCAISPRRRWPARCPRWRRFTRWTTKRSSNG